MKKKFVNMMLAFLPILSSAQTLTLEECREKAHDNYPAIKQYGLVESVKEYTVSNAAKGWLPQVSVQGGAYGFTDIIKTNEQMTKMGFDMKNYLVSGVVSVKQNVYDGGQIAASKNVAQVQAEVQKSQLDVTMRDINERVEQLFFGVLTIDEQLHQNEILQSDLSVSESTVKSLMKSGLANQSDVDAVEVERIKAGQQADAFRASRKAYIRMLGVFIGENLDEQLKVEKPAMSLPATRDEWSVKRPELSLYDMKNRLIDSQRKQLDTRLRPTIGLFGMGVMHSRMTDVIHNGTLMGGISISWNVGAIYTRKNDIRMLETQKQQNENMREIFIFNNRLQNEEADGCISSLREQLSKDIQIVNLRENIRRVNEKKVKLGTETVNELVRSVNAVSSARQQQSLHELQLLQSIYHSRTINNL